MFENSKQYSSSRTKYLFMFKNGLNRKDANFVICSPGFGYRESVRVMQNKQEKHQQLNFIRNAQKNIKPRALRTKHVTEQPLNFSTTIMVAV